MAIAGSSRVLALSAAVGLGLLLAVALAEIGLRAVETVSRTARPRGVVDSPKTLHEKTAAGRRITPNLDVVVRRHPISGRDVRVRTNRLGLRGPEIPPRVPGELRILVLGDSITFGDYVDEDETYPAQLEARLRTAAPGRPVRVVNGGGPNLGTRDEASLLVKLAPAVRPDLVLVGFYLNDSAGQVGYPDVYRIPPWLRWSRVVQRAVVGWSRYRHRIRFGSRYDWVPAFLERRWVSDREAYERLVALAGADWGAAWREDSWREVEEGFRQMLDLGRRWRFRVAAAVFPVSIQVESRVADDRPQRRFQALAATLAIPSVDLLPVLASTPGRLFYDHSHLTPAGNAAVAAPLAELALAVTEAGPRRPSE